jgi:DNA-binding NarL/FixJ family response regulator
MNILPERKVEGLISDNEIEKFKNATDTKRLYIEDYNCYLTKKEISIIRQYGQGKKIEDIAKSIFLSPKTIQTHINNVKEKLACNKASQLTKILMENNLL